MGTGTLTSRSDGEIIPAADHNELVEAFTEELVPRNASRVATDLSGQLGTSAFRWIQAFVRDYFVGDAANNLKIYEGATGELWLERSSPSDEVIKIKSDEIELVVEGVSVLRFTDDSLLGLDKYISHDRLKHQSKLAVGRFNHGGTGDVYDTIWSETLNNCVAGKQIVIDNDAYYLAEGGGSDSLDVRVTINGSEEFTDANINGDIGVNDRDFGRRHLWLYTIPSDGNYTVAFQARDADEVAGAYRVEEV